MNKTNIKILDFARRVYELTRRIPLGKVSTYQAIARAMKKPGASRAVGNALNKNPFAPQVPCHRVVRASGAIGGFASGPMKKTAMLKREGVVVHAGCVDLSRYLYDFKVKR
jgi:O-6-methylguanine DNA methyltransferase